MTLELADLRTLAWRTFDCDSCLELAGRRCLTSTGNRTSPHKARLDLARGWDARQPEVDELQLGIDRRDAIISGHADALRLAAEQATELAEQLKTARIGAALVPGLQERVAELMAQIEELTKPEPEPTPALRFGVGVDVIPAGVNPQYHRTYWTLPASGAHKSAVAQAKADLAAGRTPVLSFKLPTKGDFAGCVAGKYDEPIKSTADALAVLGGIVVAAVEHEPEKYGDLPGFIAATKHCVPLVKRPTVQFWTCFMGFHQLYGSSEWKLDKVHVEGVDGVGFDPYLSFGASSDKWTDQVEKYYKPFGAWAKSHGIQWGIWETGQNEQAATSGRPEAANFAPYCASGAKANGAAMWIWFNSETTKDGVHNWRLTTTGANKLAQFKAVVAQHA